MRHATKGLGITLLSVGFALGWIAHGNPRVYAQNRPSVKMMRVYTDATGKTREVADGQKFRLRAGDVMLVEDVTGTGHATRGIGEDSVNMLITLSDSK